MPKQLSSSCKEMVSSLITYFERERDNGGPLLPLTAVRDVSKNSFYSLLIYLSVSE